MWLLLLLAATAVAGANINPILEISSGRIQGKNINNYYGFVGIPYAKPPLGELRFQAPQEPEPWTGTKITIHDGNQCIQKSGGDEDCLYLNVFTKRLPKDGRPLMPVMFYIHGGAFIHGSGNSTIYGPEYLMRKDVVLVQINYRLNVFGFLSTGDDAAPGNAGLKDQILALKWVQKNIKKFNGDPNSVTIFGHSAGGASVLYLLQSPLARGLFHKAIAQSGSVLSTWAVQDNPRQRFHRLKTLFDIKSNNNAEVVKKLQKLEAHELFNTASNCSLMACSKYPILEANSFVPSIEHNHPEAFVSQPSIEALLENKFNRVPVMLGYVNAESSVLIIDLYNGLLNLTDINENRHYLLTNSLYLNEDEDTRKTVQDLIVKQYFPGESVTNETKFLEYETQHMFIVGIRNSAEILSRHSNVYYYKFNYKGSVFSMFQGVAHGEELIYLFDVKIYKMNDEDKKVVDKITTLWTNFAKTGNPTPQSDPALDNLSWKTFSSENPHYLDFDGQLNLKKNPDQGDYLFWKEILEKYSKYPDMYKVK